jgi:hypothetical protein
MLLPVGIPLNGYAITANPDWATIYEAAAAAGSLGPDLLSRWYASNVLVATYVTEAVYERVRRDEYPGKPTRLGSAFACGRPEAAMYFALKYRAGRTVWFYELEADSIWVANMKGLDPSIELGTFPIEEALERLRQRARGYWNSMTQDLEAAIDLPEIVLPKTGKVVREVLPPYMD